MDWVKEASLNIFGSIRRIKTKKPSSSMTAFSQITYGVSDTHFILIYQATASDVGEMVHLGMQQAAKKQYILLHGVTKTVIFSLVCIITQIFYRVIPSAFYESIHTWYASYHSRLTGHAFS